jgi:hypothetical protein
VASLFILAAAVALSGVPQPSSLGRDALEALPQKDATATLHGAVVSCRGPGLADVLATGGVAQGKMLQGAALAQAVLAEGADGYAVLFSLGELDPLLGRAPIIVALECGGKPLDSADGPFRLLAGGDLRGARSVRQLVRLRLLPPAK